VKVALVYPPTPFLPASPYASMPLLAAILRRAGHAVAPVDASLEVFEGLLEEGVIEGAERELEASWSALAGRARVTRAEHARLRGLAHLKAVPFDSLLVARDARRVLREPDAFLEPGRAARVYDGVRDLLHAFYGLLPALRPQLPDFADRLFALLEETRRGGGGPVARLLRERVARQVLAAGPDLVAVSIPFWEQLVPAFLLLDELERAAPGLPTVIGGPSATLHWPGLAPDPRFSALVDFAVVGEADESLPAFADALEGRGDLGRVPGLWHRPAGGAMRRAAPPVPPDLDGLPTPDYAGLPIGRYFLPTTLVNYQGSRGCYYGKCTFCSDQMKDDFRMRRASLVTQDLEAMQRQLGTRHFALWDPLTPPRLMRDVARWNRDRGDDAILWGADTKFERVFTDPEFTDLLYEGGLRWVQFGFESGSQRMLDRMVKGNDLARVEVMLATLERSRIAVNVTWFIGFPGETEEEARESFRFLARHSHRILLSIYTGTVHTPPDNALGQSGAELYDIDVFQRADGSWTFRERSGDAYDRTELDRAFRSRSDRFGMATSGFFPLLTAAPGRARELAAFHRCGALPESWEDLADRRPRLPAWNRRFDLEVDVLGAAPDGEGDLALGPGPARAVFLGNGGEVVPLDADDARLADRADGERTAREVAAGAGGDAQARLLALVRRGVLAVPFDARDPSAAADPAPAATVGDPRAGA